ncbi:MAG: NAD-dependent epimerase/dehydratase family protein [Paracoccaceae bacterium]
MNRAVPLIVTGAGGRIGRLLRLGWGETGRLAPVWVQRAPGGAGPVWDMVASGPPAIPAGGIVLHLAAVLPGRGALGQNAEMARALVRADRAAGFSRVVLMSSVAVYAPEAGPIPETRAPAPPSAYGRAKLEVEQILTEAFGPRLTILRLANLAGADALLGGVGQGGPVILDPVAGQAEGPVRSYIGPMTLLRTLDGLLGALAEGRDLPAVLNLAQSGALGMASLLDAAGRDWRFGPPHAETVARVEVDVARLMAISPLPPADPSAILSEVVGFAGRWP